MLNHPVEHGRTSLEPGARLRTTLPPRYSKDRPGEASTKNDARVAPRLSAISAKAMVASLLVMGSIGAGGLFLMHSLVQGDLSGSQQLGASEPHATVTPIIAIPPSTSLTAATLAQAPPRQTPPATPSSILTSSRTATTALARPQPKPLPRWHLYPFPVPTPLAMTSNQSAPPVRSPPEEASDTNTY
jgi:hypothetical protein